MYVCMFAKTPRKLTFWNIKNRIVGIGRFIMPQNSFDGANPLPIVRIAYANLTFIFSIITSLSNNNVINYIRVKL